MRKALSTLAALLSLTSATTADAEGISLRCEMQPSKVSTGSAKLDKEMNERPKPRVTRYYVIDDEARNIWLVLDGQRKPLCMTDGQCNVIYTASRVLVISSSKGSSLRFRLDRISGSLDETFTASMEDGPTINFYNSGDCVPESNLSPKF